MRLARQDTGSRARSRYTMRTRDNDSRMQISSPSIRIKAIRCLPAMEAKRPIEARCDVAAEAVQKMAPMSSTVDDIAAVRTASDFDSGRRRINQVGKA